MNFLLWFILAQIPSSGAVFKKEINSQNIFDRTSNVIYEHVNGHLATKTGLELLKEEVSTLSQKKGDTTLV